MDIESHKEREKQKVWDMLQIIKYLKNTVFLVWC